MIADLIAICDLRSAIIWARLKVSVALSNSFYFLGRDGPRDKTSGHELLFSVSSFVLGWHELSFRRVFKFFKFSVAFFVASEACKADVRGKRGMNNPNINC